MSNRQGDQEQPLPSGCQVCAAPTGDDANLCRTHEAAVVSDLRQVPDLMAELETTITRQDKLLVYNDRKSTAETPLNWNENAAQVRWELCATINAWAFEVSSRGEDSWNPLSAVNALDVHAVADWLRSNAQYLGQHPEAGTAHDEISNAVRRARGAIDHPTIRSRFYVGPCPDQLDGNACDGDVWTFLASSEDELSFMRCLACEMKWDSSQWLRVGPRIEARRQQLLRNQQQRNAA